eukprot:CAMPEP_0206822594 /NCGR_PEP_ID=MMETSP0975-20121206/12899_1 /ASSEMBLY_ACC=CAM_ASM_000399 /TAXON_ID=483370 /ORGANISM="non described non described, Strain CCMP2097" /LENGTH=86 /DNA_ID=CAMNT_0054364843 /DNA_START=57 /DNA_END=317 /DNA_ORIENTATION=+
MGRQGRIALTRKALPGKNSSKMMGKHSTSSNNVEKSIRLAIRPAPVRPRKAKMLDGAPKYESPEIPRPDGRFVFERPARGRTLERA